MIPIRDALRTLKIAFREGGTHRHISHGWVGLDCPLCSPESGRFKLGLHPKRKSAYCWTCGPVRLGDALAIASGRPLSEVLALIGDLAPERAEETRPDPRGTFIPPVGVGPLLGAHKRYLARRGFDPDELAETWGLGGIGRDGKHKWRVYIPVSAGGKPASWTTRAVSPTAGLRYLSAPPECERLPIHSVLYGADLARHAVVVVEGPADVWAIGPGAVAIMGLRASPAQISAIARFSLRAVCLDAQPAAQRRASKLADALSPLPGATYLVQLTTGKDAAEADPDEITELRKRFLE